MEPRVSESVCSTGHIQTLVCEPPRFCYCSMTSRSWGSRQVNMNTMSHRSLRLDLCGSIRGKTWHLLNFYRKLSSAFLHLTFNVQVSRGLRGTSLWEGTGGGQRSHQLRPFLPRGQGGGAGTQERADGLLDSRQSVAKGQPAGRGCRAWRPLKREGSRVSPRRRPRRSSENVSAPRHASLAGALPECCAQSGQGYLQCTKGKGRVFVETAGDVTDPPTVSLGEHPACARFVSVCLCRVPRGLFLLSRSFGPRSA